MIRCNAKINLPWTIFSPGCRSINSVWLGSDLKYASSSIIVLSDKQTSMCLISLFICKLNLCSELLLAPLLEDMMMITCNLLQPLVFSSDRLEHATPTRRFRKTSVILKPRLMFEALSWAMYDVSHSNKFLKMNQIWTNNIIHRCYCTIGNISALMSTKYEPTEQWTTKKKEGVCTCSNDCRAVLPKQ